MDKKDLAKYIDHTLLKVDATTEQITKLCQEAIKYNFCAVCVNSSRVSLCAELLQDSPVKVCSVVGFPLGAMCSKAKAFEAECAVEAGAVEVDMVINIGMFKEKDYAGVEADIAAVVQAAGPKAIVKVIIEAAMLTDDEIVKVCGLAENAGAKFVKTSTGVNTSGATVAAVELMRKSVSAGLEVKAAGGVRNIADALAMIDAGATRLGTSSGVSLVTDGSVNTSY